MANLFVRTYSFVDGQTAYGSQVESEIGNIVTVLNNLNTAATTWGQVSVAHATSVPLIADCSSGTQHIADFKNNSVIKASISSDGTITSTKTTNQVVLGTTNTTTISSTAPAASRTVTLPDAGTNSSIVLTEGAQTINGVKTFASSSLKLQEASSTDVAIIAVATLAADRTYTVPDASGAAIFQMSTDTTHPVITAWASYTPTFVGLGTVTNTSFFWKQVGDTLFVQGTTKSGTVDGSTFSITLPSGKTIDYTKCPSGTANTALTGRWYGLQTGGLIVNTAFGPSFADGSDTGKMYVALNATAGSGFTKAAGNALMGNTSYLCMEFTVPIS